MSPIACIFFQASHNFMKHCSCSVFLSLIFSFPLSFLSFIDPCIPNPGSRIPDPKTATKERGEKKLLSYLFYSHKFNKIVNYFMFEMLNKKIWDNFQRVIELFTPKIVTKLSKIWVWDPGSEIRDPEKTYSGSRIQGSKRHRIPDPDPQHCIFPWKQTLVLGF
jgi:hypothetical protein